MFKSILKAALLVISVIGVMTLLPGGKVHATDCSSYAPENGSLSNPSYYWGIASGDIAHGMSGLRVHAYNASNGNQLNVGYEVKSQRPAGSYDDTGPDGQPVNGQAKIFQWPLGTGRDSDHWFHTSTDPIRFNGDASIGAIGGTQYCDGWSVLGPGNTADCPQAGPNPVYCLPGGKVAQEGNGWVLDCQDFDMSSGQLKAINFWIAGITTPSGQDGRYGGNWTIQIKQRSSIIYQGSSLNHQFTTTNGETTFINLIWTPNPPPPDPPPDTQECSALRVYGGGQYKIYNSDGSLKKSWDTDTYVRVTQGHGPNGGFQETGTLVQGDDGALYNHIGTDASSYKDWSYKPKDFRIAVHVIRKYHHLNGSDWVDTVYQDTTNYFTCYDASCDLSMQGNVAGRGNGVESGSQFNIRAHIHNNAGPPESTKLFGALGDGGSQPLLLASTSSPVGFWYAPGQVPRGGDNSNDWTVTEPGWGIGNYGVNAKLFYDLDNNGLGGNDFVLADCSGTNYDVYKQFSLGLSSSIDFSPSAEDPNRVTYTGRADAAGPYGIPGELGGSIAVNWSANAKRKLYGGPDQTINSQGGYNNTPVLYQWSFDPRPNHAGDKYYMNYGDFCVGQVAGWIGPSNQFSADTYGGCAAGDDRIVYDEPYMNTYGADTITGSNFKTGEICDTTGSTNQTIKAYRSLEPSKGGSGTQFAALALNQITGFASASVNGAAPTGLTFANTVGVGGGSTNQPGDGGYYQGQAICAQDFYSTRDPGISKDLNVGSTSPADLTARVNSQNGGKPTQFYRNGSLTINAGNFTKQATVFVNGDVVINGNISFGTGNYLAIVAKGNIFINRGVTRMDGLYVAQPSDATHGGTIYTCASGTSDIALGSRYQLCRTQLVVNGAFAAKSVKFHRVLGSLRDSRNRETPTNWNDGTGTHAAEVFNFLPELYLYTPVFEPVTTGGPAQYYTTLPPVL